MTVHLGRMERRSVALAGEHVAAPHSNEPR